ncbi:hypothetical protein SprV_0100295100 [Sparganum proliferum]
MGLLTAGAPLSWAETKSHADFVRREGVKQFVRLWRKHLNSTGAALFWGDEIEYTLVRIDPETKEASLLLMAAELLPYLQWEETHSPPGTAIEMLWRPEYAAYMIEGTPGKPFGHLPEYLNTVEYNMQRRRDLVQKRLPDNCYIMCLTSFPRLGCPNFTYPPAQSTPDTGASRSLFYPENAIFGAHPRFKTLTRNIRERRGSKVAINLPIFRDVNTPDPFIEDLTMYHNGQDPSATSAALPNHVYLDAMGFGMGCCCLQVTFQGCCVSEARMLYDQLTTICPIVMALSAATPAIRGYLLDVDCRWGIISGAVDDRTEEERGVKPLKKDRFRIPKSRYDSVSSYISPEGGAYNDTNLVLDPEIYKYLRDEGIDELMSRHIAHLFIRDPISLFAEKVQPSSEDDTDHFENIQSTNWQSMRFKPPPANSDIGWRVEFRPMELQLTNFENAAFATFVVLLTRTILSLKLNFLIPISKVEENMVNAVKRDAVNRGRFYFRKGDLITTVASPQTATAVCRNWQRTRTPNLRKKKSTVPNRHASPDNIKHRHSFDSSGGIKCCQLKEIRPEDSYTMLSINEIINGSESFPGLIPLIRHYMAMTEVDPNTAFSIHQYLTLIGKRASGELPTAASWMRQYITSHPDYKHDSVVSSKVASDLVSQCIAVTSGQPNAAGNPLLRGTYSSRTAAHPPAATLAAHASLHERRVQSAVSLTALAASGEVIHECGSEALLSEKAQNNRFHLVEHDGIS